jgi:uncharacterized membrane protein YtjA (UPF0391 family)
MQRAYCSQKGILMSHYALLFLVIAIVAGALGFGGVAGAAVVIAKILFLVFLLLFVLSLLIQSKGAAASRGFAHDPVDESRRHRESQLQSAQAAAFLHGIQETLHEPE